MAKERQGKISGSVGPVTYYIVNGEQRVKKKSRPHGTKRTLIKKRTAAQSHQLARFAFASKLARRMRHLLDQSFEKTGAEISRCQAIRYMLSTAVYGESPDIKIDFSKLLVSRGPAPGASGAAVNLSATRKLEFTWDATNRGNPSSAKDQAILVAFGEKKQHCVFTMKGGARELGRGELDLPDHPEEAYHTWISFVKKDGTAADSIYTGLVPMS